MNLSYKELLSLKGKTLLDTRHDTLHKVTSATKTNIVLDKGITIKTNIFLESKQFVYELVDEKDLLCERAIEVIREDLESGDRSALHELLMLLPEEALENFLAEN